MEDAGPRIEVSDSTALDLSSRMERGVEDTSHGTVGSLTPASSAEHAADESVHEITVASTLETTRASDTPLDDSVRAESCANVNESSSPASQLVSDQARTTPPDSTGSCLSQAILLDSTEQHPVPLPSSTANSPEAPEHLHFGVQSRGRSLRTFPLPDWLLEHCVILRETWKDSPNFLDLLGKEAFDEKTGLLTKAEARRINAQDLANMPHTMDELWFDPLLLLARPEEKRSASNPRCFNKDVILLQSPVSSRLPNYRTRFLSSVVKQFAKTINSDLVLLDSDDIKDFTEMCWATKDEEEDGFCAADLFEQFENAGRSPRQVTARRKYPRKYPRKSLRKSRKRRGHTPVRWTEPFDAVLDAPRVKRHNQSASSDDAGNIPLVIFLSVNQSEITSDLVTSLRRVLAASSVSHRTVVFVARSCFEPEWSLGDSVSKDYGAEAFHILPTRTPQMRKLLEADDTSEQRNRNLRYLQRRIRHRKPGASKPPLTTPHVQWEFLGKLLGDSGLGRTMAREILQTLDATATDDQIEAAVQRFARRKKALEVWETSSDEGGDQWSTFPEHVQKHLKEIEEGDSSDYEFEQQLLPLLVAPAVAEEALALIAVDDDVVKAVKRAVQHHQNPDIAGSYGILEREHAGGVLLYGPPGTGKTLLARVLAASTNSIVISASAAHIQSQYCGESPKVVKALFGLARRVAPSIIYIDEADSLFSSRSAGNSRDSSSFYRETTTQLLTEMDGFSRSRDSPLVILATNLPTRLDSAVLRRVPNITYMGPPTVKLREQIFQIMLKGEVLDPAIDITRLAQMTPGYSGSDIKSLCVKAALMCDNFVESGEFQGRRLLSWSFFKQALTGAAGARQTAFNSASKPLRDFAMKNDSAGYQRMQRDDAELDLNWMQHGQAMAGNLDASSTNFRGGLYSSTVAPETSTERFATLDDNPKFPYAPLPINSRKIRLLTIHPTTDMDTQVSGDLSTVDLEDYTQSYRDFHAKLPVAADDRSEIHPSMTRHFMWNLVNIDPHELVEPRFSNIAREVSRDLALYDFCDRPLQQMKGLLDRYSWGDFLALSYAWGDPTKTHTILLNGVPFGVGDNLHAALLRLRASYDVAERGLKVWIDAICINQDDLSERSVEVQKMRLIYSEALAVRCWLGQDSLHGCDRELSALREGWDLAANTLRPKDQTSPLQILEDLRNGSVLPSSIDAVAASNDDYDALLFLKDECLFNQKYWDRLWVIQEMALASSLVFWFDQGDFFITPRECGTSMSKSWTRKTWMTEDFVTDLRFSLKECQALTKLLACRFVHRKETRLSLRSKLPSSSSMKAQIEMRRIIHLARLSQATDPRDKVFGLLAILPERISRHIEPRYDDSALTWKRSWASFSRICLEQEGNLDLLSRNSGLSQIPRASMHDFPSWAFDLTSPVWENIYEDSFGNRASVEDTLHWFSDDPHVSFAADLGLPTFFGFSDDGLRLACKAVFVDIVSAITLHTNDDSGLSVIEESRALSEPPPKMDLESARLSLGRVLSLDSRWKFPEHPTIFDVPWPDDLSDVTGSSNLGFEDHLDEDSQRLEDKAFVQSQSVSWAACFRNSSDLRSDLFSIFRRWADFELHGIPLRDYFASDNDTCPPPELLKEPAFKIRTSTLFRRLFRTRKGRIGTFMRGARPGDKIAVVGSCECPLILRPKGDKYVIVSACVVDGLMDGQAAEMVERGELEVEDIVIC